MVKKPSAFGLLRKIHEDEDGAMSLESVLLIAVIALPILVVLYKFVWPGIKTYLFEQMEDLDIQIEEDGSGGSGGIDLD